MYLGSVRFFKHLIITFILLCIAVPVFFCIRFNHKYNEAKTEIKQMNAVMSQYENEPKTPAEEDNLTKLLDSSFSDHLPTIQENIDESVSEQVKELQEQLDTTLNSRMKDLQKQIDNSLAMNTSDLSTQQSDLQQQLAVLIVDQADQIEADLKDQLAIDSEEMMNQLSEALSDQLTIVLEQLNQLQDALDSGK